MESQGFLEDIAAKVKTLRNEHSGFTCYAKEKITKFLELHQQYLDSKKAATKQQRKDFNRILSKKDYRLDTKKYFSENKKTSSSYRKKIKPPTKGLIAYWIDLPVDDVKDKDEEAFGWIRPPLQTARDPISWPKFIKQADYSNLNLVYYTTTLAVIHDFVMGGRDKPLLPKVKTNAFCVMWHCIEGGYQGYTDAAIENCLGDVKADLATGTPAQESLEQSEELKKWSDLSITIIDENTVKYKILDGAWQTATNLDLGFADKRTKGKKIRRIWGTFLLLAQYSDKSAKFTPGIQKNVERVSNIFREYFKLKEGSPIYYSKRFVKYTFNFNIKDERTL